jgi:DNA-directed RNA polymerase subunit RPC12/RpoP
MFAPTWAERVTRLIQDVITLGAMLLGAVAFVSAILLLRCPSCGHSLFWHAVSKLPVGQWLNWLLDVQACPVCGYTNPEPPNTSVPAP